ncbi:NAD(P)/FAD-dependent oxidoreductase [Candidatus Berkiella cookevillensis]|uniref:NADH:ubiquinone reductase (non-electrogenic) n=1 Tax=Candidatus Berkiella cookevillensis TaxID=437022 RepID=A0A0Q9YCC3_9GAMM|nr:NAD(P)/FAD-dependent oxidoreductase [Candidatus Berkiella cookevillensis]MCS5708686.1 NAD(P)/FAD-dependent oxidoreductase [Candidatus Berkiella cookevillensis]
MQKNFDVVIVGAGFAGLSAAKALTSSSLSVCLIDKTNHHLFQPLLYQVATAALSPANIAYPIREVFKKNPSISTLMAEVVKINFSDKNIELNNAQIIHYTYLILCPGSMHHYFDHPEWEAFAPGLKTLSDALTIRDHTLAAFENAEKETNPETLSALLNFVIVGGGPTGVEMAGSIAEIAHQSLNQNFRQINPINSQIYLIEAGAQLLAGYPATAAEQTKQDLEKLHVTIKLNHRVTNINEKGVFLESTSATETTTLFIPSHNIVWAAGNQVSPLIKALNVKADRSGRVYVNPDLSIPEHPNVFVLGDCAHFPDAVTGKPLPAVAPTAKQMGQFVGNLIKNEVKQSTPRGIFKYQDWGMMATIGKYKAIVLSGPIKCSGLMAWIMWGIVHIFFLISFRMKVIVFFEWMYYFFRGQRNSRLIVPRKEKHKPDLKE